VEDGQALAKEAAGRANEKVRQEASRNRRAAAYMLPIMRDPSQPVGQRDDMANAAAPPPSRSRAGRSERQRRPPYRDHRDGECQENVLVTKMVANSGPRVGIERDGLACVANFRNTNQHFGGQNETGHGHQQILSAVLSTTQAVGGRKESNWVWVPSCVTVRDPKRWDHRWFGSLKRDSCNDINVVGRTLPPPVLLRPTFSADFQRAKKPNNHGLRAKTSELRYTRRDPKLSLSARLSPNLPTTRI
jgi:hypothetical protein